MILVFASSKGGVGKSTSCAAVGSSLALEGAHVLVIDLDPNATIARWGKKFPLDGLTIEAVAPTDFMTVIKDRQKSESFDHILIDLMGTREVTMVKALGLADLVIIPAQPSEPDMREALVISKDVRDLSEMTKRDIPHRLLLTKVYPLRTRVMDFIITELARLKLPTFRSVLVERTAYREMFLTGEPPSRGESKKGAGPEIAALLDEIRELVSHPTRRAAAKPKVAA